MRRYLIPPGTPAVLAVLGLALGVGTAAFQLGSSLTRSSAIGARAHERE